MFDNCLLYKVCVDTMSKKSKKSQVLTDAEWDIIKVVWAEQPCTAGAIQEALEQSRGWAYSTAKKIMDRMVEKGLLKVTRIRNLQLFSAVLTERQARRRELKRTILQAFDGATAPALHMLLEADELDAADLRELKQWLREAEKRVHE